jgi:broad specificity phosphatase PhoE
MPRLLLIRHASHDLLGRELVGRRPGVHLSAGGRAEAEALAERLCRLGVDSIYSSPRERAMETAEPIARRAGSTVLTEPALDEVDFGAWTGMSLERLREEPLWRRFNRDRTLTRIPGGETMAETAARMIRFFDRLIADHPGPGESIALVGHGDPLRAAIAQSLGMPLDYMLRLEIAAASLSILRIDEFGISIELLNDRSHLLGVTADSASP